MTGRASIRSCAGQVLVAGFSGVSPPEVLLAAVRRGELAGVILFRRNLETPAQAAELNAIGRLYVQLRYGRATDPRQLLALRRGIRGLRLRPARPA